MIILKIIFDIYTSLFECILMFKCTRDIRMYVIFLYNDIFSYCVIVNNTMLYSDIIT